MAKGIRWRGFLIRLAMVAGAALAISVVTYIAVPGAFIFFGILHEIALASLLGLAFLRLPALVTLVVAAAVIAAPFYARAAMFDHPWWWWLGLSADGSALQRLRARFPMVRRSAGRHRRGEARRAFRPARAARAG